MTIKVISAKILKLCKDLNDPLCGMYVSELRLDIHGVPYGSQVIHPASMIENTFISFPSQRAYIKYDLVRKIGIEIESEIFKKLEVLN